MMIQSITQFVAQQRPDEPLEIIMPDRLRANAERLVSQFCGHMLYAVKCNPLESVLKALWQGGIRHFDAASIEEVALVRRLFPEAGIHFMHPVKTRSDIRQALDAYGVTSFAVDSMEEYLKLRDLSQGALGLNVLVRLALPKGGAGRDQSGKFGVDVAQCVRVIQAAQASAKRVGITFHVGSQCLDPQAYLDALSLTQEVQKGVGFDLDLVDVGGGFPVSYADCEAPAFERFAQILKPLSPHQQLWCEPGRALAACGLVLVLRVIGRKDNALFLNDGIYGGLAPDPVTGYRYHSWLIPSDGRAVQSSLQAFRLFGPTCDSHDVLPVSYALPEDVGEGDWIAFDNAGAYATALRSRFNGMGKVERVIWEE